MQLTIASISAGKHVQARRDGRRAGGRGGQFVNDGRDGARPAVFERTVVIGRCSEGDGRAGQFGVALADQFQIATDIFATGGR
jgi:hypothetical protein